MPWGDDGRTSNLVSKLFYNHKYRTHLQKRKPRKPKVHRKVVGIDGAVGTKRRREEKKGGSINSKYTIYRLIEKVFSLSFFVHHSPRSRLPRSCLVTDKRHHGHRQPAPDTAYRKDGRKTRRHVRERWHALVDMPW